ncbi:LysR family transcriptional regulator [Lactobacillus pasteurii]|uniref:LysR substrate binding domain protein n=1 Tax=Lactobacillus pasteurii DSM 23907 = CRBIP 24.76 TaxID=1423790 RepID=I7KL55_9LACO|nr:LysR family transcriptional regulator [Lactobacillus pasteurii]TDG78167.1 hypothetical protein C5L33_000230 [Lactobacillus pasteurii]CCI85094.1 LysR substrate binding domain protein [Lactobacillus pasteurii DSM 23907 = CRBIP 24.76]
MNDPEALLHYLDILLKESNFTKAAHELYISQPYLTQLIKRIETKLGTSIINRDSVPFTLTEAGAIYYQYLENLIYDNLQLDRKLAAFTRPEHEIIRIGILESLGTFLLPELLPPFLKENKDVEIQLFENVPRNSETRLLNEQIDCYIGQTPETLSRGLKFFINGGERYYVVIPPNSPYFQPNRFILDENEYPLEKLLHQPLVLSAPESAIRHQVNGLLQKFKLKPQIAIESSSVITATNLAIHGLGLTISTASILKRIAQTPINLMPIDVNLLKLEFFIAVKENRPLSPKLAELIKAFESLNLESYIK